MFFKCSFEKMYRKRTLSEHALSLWSQKLPGKNIATMVLLDRLFSISLVITLVLFFGDLLVVSVYQNIHGYSEESREASTLIAVGIIVFFLSVTGILCKLGVGKNEEAVYNISNLAYKVSKYLPKYNTPELVLSFELPTLCPAAYRVLVDYAKICIKAEGECKRKKTPVSRSQAVETKKTELREAHQILYEFGIAEEYWDIYWEDAERELGLRD